jgi:hypothetical protein
VCRWLGAHTGLGTWRRGYLRCVGWVGERGMTTWVACVVRWAVWWGCVGEAEINRTRMLLFMQVVGLGLLVVHWEYLRMLGQCRRNLHRYGAWILHSYDACILRPSGHVYG